MCTDRDGIVGDSAAYDNGSTRSGQGSSINGGGANDGMAADAVIANAHSKTSETLGVELADSTANFLEQLLLLIDRGFVLQRLRDLLTLLEIRHNMVSFVRFIAIPLSPIKIALIIPPVPFSLHLKLIDLTVFDIDCYSASRRLNFLCRLTYLRLALTSRVKLM